ncbi:hypothetical protein EV378_4877 [Pseudonocardia endophytica]|uniref:Uncharacterized protein n=2 Tax=Pseudonocardia endophytica TaxID=401976 RepID=A0A4R1HIW6_PSEEN|nr:hypothetical protein EV378_4877 [Pseudonocardia endophytica]
MAVRGRPALMAGLMGAAVVGPALASVGLSAVGDRIEILRPQADGVAAFLVRTPHDPTFALDAADAERAHASTLVLDYPDVRPAERPGGSDAITTAAFERQLAMLAQAGFGPGGAPLEIRFPRATTGVWRYAEPVLSRYGLTATTTSAREPGAPSGYLLNGRELAALHLGSGWAVSDTPLPRPSGPAVNRVAVGPGDDERSLFGRIVAGLPAPAPAESGPMLPGSWTPTAGNALRTSDEGLRLRTATPGGSTSRLWAGRAGAWSDYAVSLTWSLSRTATGAVVLRDGSTEPLRVVLGQGAVRVVDVRERTLAVLGIDGRGRHALDARLAGDRLEITVDGAHAVVPVARPDSGGALALRVDGAPGTELLVRRLQVT